MSIGVIVEFTLKAEGRELWIQTMRERVPHTREWDGCDYVYLQADQDDPNHLYLVERWASREQYERYRESMMSLPGWCFAILPRERLDRSPKLLPGWQCKATLPDGRA